VLVLIEASLNGQHVALLGFMLTLAAALLGLRQYLQQKNHAAHRARR
jgi:O-acetylserine/cysteine efflux transporter